MLKHKKAALVAAALALPGVALAEDDPIPISANVTFTSDYIFRGISQTSEKPAVQGGFDWESAATGFYVGTWGSNVSWTGESASSVEIDVYGGWKKSWGDWGVDLGLIHYDYPGASGANTDEVYATGSWKWISASYYYTVSDDWFGVTDGKGSGYFNVAAAYTFPMGISVGGSWGTTMLDGSSGGVPNDTNDYDDYKIYAGYSYTGLDFELGWTDTDIDNPSPEAEDRVYFSVSKSF
ncbi:MAG: TorF family putative porin [Burkholderiales bacterium]|jgi:uncharacterized protein (TIGR02001 family)